MSKLHIKKGDTVCIIAGESKSQDRSNGTWKTGKVLKVLVKEQKVIVEGFNMISKSTKPNAKNPQGGIIKQEAPIHISNVALVDPKTGKPTRVAIKVKEDGTKVRIAKKSGEEIKLGKLYSTDKLGAKDEEKSFAFYQIGRAHV